MVWAGGNALAETPPDPSIAEGAPVEIAKSFSLQSDVLGLVRRINVYLPPSYHESDKLYPALYLLDGGVHEDFFHIAGIASLAAEFRGIREFVLIGIEGIDRYHDLIHPSSVESDRKRLPTSGGSAKFREFLAKELLPYAQSKFRLSSEQVLIGESAAGMFVVETLLRRPEMFEGYIAVSPMLWWDDQSLAKSSVGLLASHDHVSRKRLYLTIANEGGAMRAGVDKLVQALKGHEDRITLMFRPMPSETHGTIFHPAALDAVRLIFAVP